MGVYKRIDGNNYKNIFVLGDLHGCYDLLMNELKQANFDFETDLLVSVGDLIDRGRQNLECLRLLKEKWFDCVQGNHEEMAIRGVLHNEYDYLACWVQNGGSWFFKAAEQDKAEAINLLKIAETKPIVIEIAMPDRSNVVIVHADYPCNEYEFGKDISKKEALWSRERLESYSEMSIYGANMFVFGHTPQEEVFKTGNRLYIDTGAVFGGELTIIKLV